MIFYVESETDEALPLDPEAVGRQVAEAVLLSENCPFEACISLLLTDDDGIRALNRTHRKKDETTDVLSFPALSFPAPADYARAGWDTPAATDPDTGTVWLGDIVVNVGRVSAQAEAYGHGTGREFAFLIAHSVLHLIGYDHETAADAAGMEARQERVLRSLGFTRE
ncbi:MAG: rRNA maturation RNase YbeY [Lachnospiraceae bacterium]|nr:rRNA maturation RNase YbeY [Lachnospiraceae bacterium]